MTLKISKFTVCPLTRDEVEPMLASSKKSPDCIDFADVVSVSHCFAHELVKNLPAHSHPTIVNASPYVRRIVSSVAPHWQ